MTILDTDKKNTKICPYCGIRALRKDEEYCSVCGEFLLDQSFLRKVVFDRKYYFDVHNKF